MVKNQEAAAIEISFLSVEIDFSNISRARLLLRTTAATTTNTTTTQVRVQEARCVCVVRSL